LISTLTAGRVINYDGTPLPFRGEDGLGFCATSLGTPTVGKWHMLLDGLTPPLAAHKIDGRVRPP